MSRGDRWPCPSLSCSNQKPEFFRGSLFFANMGCSTMFSVRLQVAADGLFTRKGGKGRIFENRHFCSFGKESEASWKDEWAINEYLLHSFAFFSSCLPGHFNCFTMDRKTARRGERGDGRREGGRDGKSPNWRKRFSINSRMEWKGRFLVLTICSGWERNSLLFTKLGMGTSKGTVVFEEKNQFSAHSAIFAKKVTLCTATKKIFLPP